MRGLAPPPCFIFGLVVGRGEVQSDHALNLIPLWGLDYHTGPSCSSIGRSVHINIPLSDLLCPLAIPKGEFDDKASHHLPIYSCSRTVLYIKFTKLHCPQSHSSYRLGATHGSSQGLVRQDNDGMCLEVRLEFLRCGYQREGQLFHLKVPLSCFSERLACKVDWSLRSVFLFYQSCANGGDERYTFKFSNAF